MLSTSFPTITGLVFCIGAVLAPLQVVAETLLTVTHEGKVQTYDLDALKEMGAVTFETKTIWTDGPQSFTGVSLLKLAEELNLEDGVLLASAINDYTVEIPISDAVEGGPIIAYLNNGEPMSVRDKGPLWIVYPYDSDPKYRSELIYSRSIWQLDRIETSD
ncbi:molybdopterin-dependent oxidoreductase [Yoonia sp.]|uniref:molybdopterin-dependent oxidoreductase n=1 Tax=Yoonia sp. TaxID=2212373 RepID=UPI002E090F6E|nr:oxidoreductase [Yoonia sp.]